MGFLHLLEDIRIPVLNEFMLGITYLGDEIAFLVVALILMWCADKKSAYFVLSVGFLGTIFNQFLKLWFRVPRPWIMDENFTIIEQAREGASGYSFPSGHTQSAVGTFGGIASITKNKLLKGLCIAAAIIVPFSRMYLGVHTPLDVGVSIIIAIALIFLLKKILLGENERVIPVLWGIMVVIAIGFVCFVEFFPFPEDTDLHNLESGLKNAYTLLGSISGMVIVYFVDKKWLNFPTKAVWWAQIVKVMIGLGIVLAIKSGLKAPLDAIFGELPGRAVRYAVLVLVAGIVWPLSFRWFAKLGTKE